MKVVSNLELPKGTYKPPVPVRLATLWEAKCSKENWPDLRSLSRSSSSWMILPAPSLSQAYVTSSCAVLGDPSGSTKYGFFLLIRRPAGEPYLHLVTVAVSAMKSPPVAVPAGSDK